MRSSLPASSVRALALAAGIALPAMIVLVSAGAIVHAEVRTTDYTYDRLGRLTTANDGSTEIVYTYDEGGNLLDVLRSDYIRTARAKGLSRRTVLLKHSVRNAINPLITLFGYSISDLLSGAFLVEVVMSLPGLGRTTVEAFFDKDLFLVTASVLVATFMLVMGNLLADILLALSDPRITFKAADG